MKYRDFVSKFTIILFYIRWGKYLAWQYRQGRRSSRQAKSVYLVSTVTDVCQPISIEYVQLELNKFSPSVMASQVYRVYYLPFLRCRTKLTSQNLSWCLFSSSVRKSHCELLIQIFDYGIWKLLKFPYTNKVRNYQSVMSSTTVKQQNESVRILIIRLQQIKLIDILSFHPY